MICFDLICGKNLTKQKLTKLEHLSKRQKFGHKVGDSITPIISI